MRLKRVILGVEAQRERGQLDSYAGALYCRQAGGSAEVDVGGTTVGD